MIKISFLIIFYFLLIYLFAGCKKSELGEKKNEFVTYTIPEGKHRSTSKIKIYDSEELKFKILFDSSAVYTSSDPKNQYAINKLFGFSDCDSKHHKNSARVGWRWLNNNLEIFAYCYSDSERSTLLLTTIDIGKEYDCNIKAIENNYFFTVNDKSCLIKRGCHKSKLKYYLYPYFGGIEPASHDITIKIKKL